MNKDSVKSMAMSHIAISLYRGAYPEEIGNDPSEAKVVSGAGVPEVAKETWEWKKIVQLVAAIFYYLLLPITYPLKLLFEYVYPCTLFMENLLRAAIFSSDLQEVTCGQAFLYAFGLPFLDQERVNRTRDNLQKIGAEFVQIEVQDGHRVQLMHLTQENFRRAIEASGGSFIWHGDQEIIAGGTLQETLKALGWPQTEGGVRFRQRAVLQHGESDGVVMRIHPSAYLSFFEKKYLINHLALGKDVIFYDKEPGKSSEERVYLDAKAVYSWVKQKYDPTKIWITAKCSGVSAATFLREQFIDDDFHMVLENGFLHFDQLVKKHAPFIEWVGMKVLWPLSSDDPNTVIAAKEIVCDHFNNQRKLESAARLRQDWKSSVVVISTDTDGIVEPNAGREMARLGAGIAGNCYHLVHRGIPDTEGHRDEPLSGQDGPLFAVYSRILTDGKQIVQSNF